MIIGEGQLPCRHEGVVDEVQRDDGSIWLVRDYESRSKIQDSWLGPAAVNVGFLVSCPCFFNRQ